MPVPEKGMLDAVNAGIAEASPYEMDSRPDGKPKGEGWLGPIKHANGKIATEITAGVNIHGKETGIPLMVPTLDANEVRHLMSVDPRNPDFFKTLPPTIMQKAVDHAMQRIAEGKSPYNE